MWRRQYQWHQLKMKEEKRPQLEEAHEMKWRRKLAVA
jgi:hypothetical protein